MGKYWWEEDNKQAKDQQKKDQGKGYWWEKDGTVTNTATTNITDRVNSWLKNHSSYISDYQKRYSGRKGTYEDSYVSDSASWLDKVSKQKSNFDAEADSILAYMDQYKGYLDAKWMDDVRKTIAGARDQQKSIYDSAVSDNQWWSSFGSEDLVKQYGSAEEAYKYFQRGDGYNKKYEGKTLDELQTAMDALPEGEEKDWLAYNTTSLAKGTLSKNADWAERSKYKSTYRGGEKFNAFSGMYTDTGYDDITYDYINRDEKARKRQLVNDIASDASFLGLDTSYLKEMTDDEIAVYNYLYDPNDTTAADKYLAGLLSDLNYRQRETQQKYWADYAKEHPVLSSGFSVVTAPLKGVSAIGQFADYAADGTIDQNAAYNKFSYAPSAIREQVSSDIATPQSGVWGEIGSWTYQLGMSMGDFLINSAVSGGNSLFASALMSTGAMADTVISAKDRGLSDDQALILGVVSGAAELVTEKFSLDALLKGDLSKGAMRYILTNALTEGTEEVSSSVINLLADVLVSKDKSEWKMQVQDYINKNPGATEQQAFWKVLGDTTLSLGLDFVGGALMGGVMGTAGAGINYLTDGRSGLEVNKDAVKQYGGQTDALIQEGLGNDKKSESYKLAQHYQQQVQGKNGKGGKALTGAQIRNLLAANQEQVTAKDMQLIQQAAEKRLAKLGQKTDVSKIAELATRYATGGKLTRAERSFLVNSQYGPQVTSEMLDPGQEYDNLLSKWENDMSGDAPVEFSRDWIENVGTRSVNRAAYDKTAYEAEQQAKAEEAVRALVEHMKSSLEESASSSANDQQVISQLEEQAPTKVAEDGVTRQVSTDNEITPQKIVSIDGGNVMIQTDSGTISANDIAFGDENTDLLWRGTASFTGITPQSANGIIRAYLGKESVSTYLRGAAQEFQNGYYNKNSGGVYADKLTPAQREIIYNLGQKSAGENTAKAQAKATAAKKAAASKTGKVGKVHFDRKGRTFDAVRETALTTMEQLSAALGVEFYVYESYQNAAGEFVYKDASGNEVHAPNGYYDPSDGSIHIDLNAGATGKGTMLFTVAHELTHFIKQWSPAKFKVLANVLVKQYSRNGATVDSLVEAQIIKAENNNRKLTWDEAFEEVVADSMESILTSGNVVQAMAEVKKQDKGLWKKICDWFKDLAAKLRAVTEAYKDYKPDSKEGKMVAEMRDVIAELEKVYTEALVEAGDNFQAAITAKETQSLTEAGIGFDEDTKTVYSLRYSTAYNDTIQVGKKSFDTEALAQIVAKGTGRSIEDARKWVNSEMAIANIVMANPEFLDFEADNRYAAIKKNSDYPQGTVDLSNLCPKREEFTAMFDKLQKAYPNKIFTAQDIADMRKILANNGITVACGACFVEDRRQLVGEIAETFIGMWTEAVESGKPLQKTNAAGNKSDLLVTNALAKQYGLTPGTKIMATDTYIPNQYDLTTYEGFKLLEKNHPTIAMAFNRYNNSRGQQSARLIEGRAEYNRQILGWSDAKVRSVNNNGGLRIFSFSDFEVVHLLDLVQVIIDCAARGVKIQGYTKIPAFAKLIRGTGIKLNRSLIPKGDYGYHMENGKVVLDYDSTEGIDINDENFIDESSNPDVGNIVIGINPTQIAAAMLDPFIDYIIPFHSNKAKAILEKLGTGKWVNYKESQHEKDKSTGTASKKNVNIYTDVINKYHPKNKVEFVEAFLKECKRQDKIPRYAEFLNVDSNGDYTYREGYHKLLVDFKMFDADGNILPQGKITPNLNEGFMKDLLNAEVKKKQDYKFPQKVYDDIDQKFGEKASQSLDNEPSGVVQYSSKNQEQESGSNDEGRVQTGPTESARGDRENQGDTLDGRGDRADGRRSAKDKEWRDIDSSIRKGVKKVVKSHINRSPNFSELYDYIVALTGKSESELTPYSYGKAVDKLTESVYADAINLHPVLFENKWAIFGDGVSKLRTDILDATHKDSGSSTNGVKRSDRGKTATEEVPYRTVLKNLNEYSREDLVGIADQVTDGAFKISNSMSKDSLVNVLRETISILGKDEPTLTFKVPVAEVMPAAEVSPTYGATTEETTGKIDEKQLAIKLRELHKKIGDINNSMNNTSNYIQGVDKLRGQLQRGEITATQYDEQLGKRSAYYRDLLEQSRTAKKEFDQYVKEIERIEGKSWQYIRREVLYGLKPKRTTLHFSDRGTAERDQAYMAAVERGDMETAQKLVEDAAKSAGFVDNVFHGTKSFGFTKPETTGVEPGKEWSPFFATNNIYTAMTYSGVSTKTDIGKEKRPKKSISELRYEAEALLANGENATTGFVTAEHRDSYIEQYGSIMDNATISLIKAGAEGAFAIDSDHTEFKFVPYEDGYSAKDYESKAGNYGFYANTDGFLIVDGGGREWNHLRSEYGSTTRIIAKNALEAGYKGVKVKNVYDTGWEWNGSVDEDTDTLSDVYIFFNPQEQVKSADPVTYDDSGNVIPLSERFKKENKDIRYSDRAYMDAVEHADMDTAQRMVDEAAKKAGYTVSGHHGTNAMFNKFSPDFMGRNGLAFGPGFYFTTRRGTASSYEDSGGRIIDAYLKVEKSLSPDEKTMSYSQMRKFAKALAKVSKNQKISALTTLSLYSGSYTDIDIINNLWYRARDDIRHEEFFGLLRETVGYDSVKADFEGANETFYVVFNADQIKSSDPVTYDDDGNVIPLSERFNAKKDDFRYSERDPEQEKVTRLLEKENADLKEDVAYLRELVKLQSQVTDGTKFTKTSVEAAAGNLIKSINAKGDKKELAKLLNGVYEYIANGEEITFEGIKEEAQAAVNWLTSRVQADETPAGYSYDDELFAQEVMRQVYDSYWNVSTLRTVADKYQKQINQLKYEHSKRMSALREYHKEKTAKLKKEHKEKLQRVRQEYRERMDKQYKDITERYRESRKKREESREKTELRRKIRKTIRELDKILNRGNKKRNVKEDMKDFVAYALASAEILFTDNYSNEDMIRNGVETQVDAKENRLIEETQRLLRQRDDLYSVGAVKDELDDVIAGDTSSYDKRMEMSEELDKKIAKNMSALRSVFERERARINSASVSGILDGLAKAYKELGTSDNLYVRNAVDENVYQHLRSMSERLDGAIVKDMNLSQLEDLYKAYTMVLHTVRSANQLFVKGKTESIEQIAGRIMGDFSKRKAPEGTVATVLRNLSNKIGWDYEKLYYALDRIGSEAFTELVMNIANSENIVMQDVMEAAAFRDEMVKKYGFNNWDVNKKIDREFLDNTGKKFNMTLGQMMALYAYSRREGAWDHIEYGGFVFGDRELTNPRPADSYKLTKEQCEEITDLLTKEQKSYVEDMQKFLSETMGEKGNEVSMMLYGIKMFTEKNYFPIHIAGQFKAQANESQAKEAAGFSSMTNAGFTHAQNPNAKAPFVLEGFNEIWVDHVNEMSRYHGTVPALEDMRRVMNRSSYSETSAESMSLKQMMENAYGKEAVDYFDNLYREANSGAITDKLQKTSKWLLSMFRKNSVAYSLSVLVQQPASLVRAYSLIDKKYFGFKGFGTITSGVAKAVSDKWTKAHTNAYNEMLKYAPGVTMAKEIGGFDTATGGSIRSYLLDTGKSLKQKWKTGTAAEKGKAVLDLVDDNAIANLPNLADKIAWIEIWNACKREAVAKHKDLAPNSEEFMQAVGERFTEVIRATQVYDSIFAKSPMLKSKNLAVQYLVSFMNEPNTVANMAESAVREATKGNWKGGLRTAGVLIHSIIFTNVMKSIIYAMRDDDEDETYTEKYIEAVAGNMMSDFNPLNYIPVARDVVSLAQGYDVERADMAVVSDAIDAITSVIKNATKETDGMTEEQLVAFDKKVTEANWKLVETLASFFGIPVKNIRREIMGVINHAKTAHANVGKTTEHSALEKAIESAANSIPFVQTTKAKQDKLYDAIISGDKTYVSRLKAGYKDDAAYNSAVRKALRENDPRIHEAAQARYNGNIAECKRIYNEIKNEGNFSPSDILEAINSEESKIRNEEKPETVSSSYSSTDFVNAVIVGDTRLAATMKDDIISAKVANGKSKEEAEEAFISSVATATRNAFDSSLLDEAGAKKMLLEYADMDEEEIDSKVRYWAMAKAYPQYREDLSEARVEKYNEFAKPSGISLDVFVQYLRGTSGLETKYDKWGDVEESVRDQVLAVIDSLPITWEQKDALYLAAGYAESNIWDVPW